MMTDVSPLNSTLVSETVFYSCARDCKIGDCLHWVLSKAEVDPTSSPILLFDGFKWEVLV